MPLDGALAAFAFEPPVDRLVHRLKYRGDLALATTLGLALASVARTAGARPPDVLVPMPLHRRRLARRGFNQAAEIARHAGRSLGIHVAFRAARRRRATAAQTGLAGAPRRVNVRGAFDASPVVAGRRIAVVDDVLTTGATAFELARALRRAGAAEVVAWAVARADSATATSPGKLPDR